jgi:hypothetical protein
MSTAYKPAQYWRGVANGILYGLATAFLLPRLFRLTQSPRRAPRADHEARPNADSVLRGYTSVPQTPQPDLHFVSKRDSPESAGDPHAVSGIAFNLPGGAPGPRQPAEQLTMPGRPGQLLHHDDPRQKVEVSRRTVNVRGR